ncbi:MAG: NAD(P)-dependent oxidoreductase [Bacillota bacterium]|nr:NAD(P)-dependent oxidoreductase [Bacillota bacterium]
MWTDEKLNGILAEPSQLLIESMDQIIGDIMILGAGGKMGPTLAMLAARARQVSRTAGRVIAVSRFSDPTAADLLRSGGVEIMPADLLAEGSLDRLPDVPNIIYMAGRKFGTAGGEAETWALNASLPTLVSRRFKEANFVVFSTGNIYPMASLASGGCTEETPPEPVGEYAMSSLARERIFEHASRIYGSRVLLFRLNYAVDLRYGVLHDLARKIMQNEPISLKTPAFNCIWQGYANEVALRSLLLAESPAGRLNVTGPETVSVAYAASKLGKHLDRQPVYIDEPSDKAYLSNAGRCLQLLGYPQVSLNTLIRWQAEWLVSGGRSLGKPTHFDERGGKY